MKRVPLLVFSIFVIAALLTTPVMAQTELPGFLEDSEWADLSGDTQMFEDLENPRGMDPQFSFQPISPKDHSIFTTTPKFYFTRYPGVTQYKLMVYDIKAAKFVYEGYTGTVTCGTSYCWLQPTIALKPYQYNKTGGYYNWKVGALVGSTWIWSPLVEFDIFTKEVSSTFDLNTNKWLPLSGTWTRIDPGYYKTPGEYGKLSSIILKNAFINNYVLEVKMKRKTETGSNLIYFKSAPGILSSSNYWQNGYYFRYDNNGGWGIVKVSNYSQSTLYSATSIYLEPYDWNTIKLWVTLPLVRVWINGVYIGIVNDPSYIAADDYIGIGMVESLPDKSPLLIDFVSVYYSYIWPGQVPPSENGEPAQDLILNP